MKSTRQRKFSAYDTAKTTLAQATVLDNNLNTTEIQFPIRKASLIGLLASKRDNSWPPHVYQYMGMKKCGYMKNSLSSVSKESTCNAGDQGSLVLGRFPWRRKWQSPPVFLPGKSH